MNTVEFFIRLGIYILIGFIILGIRVIILQINYRKYEKELRNEAIQKLEKSALRSLEINGYIASHSASELLEEFKK